MRPSPCPVQLLLPHVLQVADVVEDEDLNAVVTISRGTHVAHTRSELSSLPTMPAIARGGLPGIVHPPIKSDMENFQPAVRVAADGRRARHDSGQAGGPPPAIGRGDLPHLAQLATDAGKEDFHPAVLIQ